MKLTLLVYYSCLLCSSSLFVYCQRIKNVVNKSPNCLGLLSTLSTANEVDGKFTLLLEHGSKVYEPFEKYSIILKSNDINTHFKEFNIIAESEEKNPKASVGRFERYKEALTKYSDDCPNGVTQSSLLPKQEIKVFWIAPPSGSGCVRIRAAARSTTNLEQWITSAKGMSFVICEENQFLDGQPKILLKCTACDEAKYGVEITGLWSRNTHPVDYPNNNWDAGLSAIVGASHSNQFHIFSKGEVASEPLRMIAEDGETKPLIQLMNDRERKNEIRTIIKAKGITHPLLNSKTFAEFRVDRDHHLMSLVAKLDPSPDWFVGVDSLELCSKNGSWIDEKQMNLYLYDAGTDGGSGYMMANKMSLKFKDKIYQLTNLHPEGSPFYNLNDSKIKPFARIKVVKQRLFPSKKPCRIEEAIEEEEDIDDSLERYLVYGEENNSASSQSPRRRPGSYGRGYAEEDIGGGNLPAYMPDNGWPSGSESEDPNNLEREKDRTENNEPTTRKCMTTEWTEWDCQVLPSEPRYPVCGNGKMTRTREWLIPENAEYCTEILGEPKEEGVCNKECGTGNINYQTGDKEGYYANGRRPGRNGYGRQEDIYAPNPKNWVNKKYETEDDTSNRYNAPVNEENSEEKGDYESQPNENNRNIGYPGYEEEQDSNYPENGPTSREPSFTDEDSYLRVPESCIATDWSEWSSCFGECSDYRYRNRTRSLITFESICLGMPLVEQKPCPEECPGANFGSYGRGGRQRMRIMPRNVTPRMMRPNARMNNNRQNTRSENRANVRMETRANTRTEIRPNKRNEVRLSGKDNVGFERRRDPMQNKNNLRTANRRLANSNAKVLNQRSPADLPVRENRDKARASSKNGANVKATS